MTTTERRDRAPSDRRGAAPRAGVRPPGPVRARLPLTREGLAERVDAAGDVALSRDLRSLWDLGAEESRLLADRHRRLAALWTPPVTDPESDDPADLVELQVACSLRTTRGHASALVRDAHRAVTAFPLTLARLSAGQMPAEWFTRLLRRSSDLDESACARLDGMVSRWDAGITAERFRRELARAIAWVAAGQPAPACVPDRLRRVETFAREDGTATLAVTGPVPEIFFLSTRLDAGARAVQTQQRRALEAGSPIPFDDGTVAESGRPLTLAALRYALLVHSVHDTGGIEVPAQRYRLNVLVPALTLLGESDAPGVIEGIAPIPAPLARDLAGQVDTWYRVLTDPTTGAFLPLAPQRYRPTPSMLEHLRLRGAQCAVPGCTGLVTWASEADHIEEYDHLHPERGGRTEVENLHDLCWKHHSLKTAGTIDPVRVPGVIEVRDAASGMSGQDEQAEGEHAEREHAEGEHVGEEPSSPWPLPPLPAEPPPPHTIVHPGRTAWHLGLNATITVTDDTDLTTPAMARAFYRAWARCRQRDGGGAAPDEKTAASKPASASASETAPESQTPPTSSDPPAPPFTFDDPPPY
ncbi:HNH endonuclease [Brachybacterium huguangmaarense]|uniref:HNH endonuclease n=1 Tax=Brachybacterium huguangmaarense TaxID=1652028 RepID=A0ABY6G4H4_9MICO|nr:HNH endonuclease signature motif containing protein [Brachybacterium huguangmaarense]UYG18012.1 HNH endonuclease [Brachybacterium huguangmaarense]